MTTTEVEQKTLAEMSTEVQAYLLEKGWTGPESPPVSLEDALALLHSEVSEALEAWRVWQLVDGTNRHQNFPKPEGVGSEFADILIRLLDDAIRFGVDLLDTYWDFGWDGDGTISAMVNAVHTAANIPLPPTFGAAMNRLHDQIGRCGLSGLSLRANLLGVLLMLLAYSSYYGVDLAAEYERKMAYNRRRPFRHGGKAL